MFFINRKPNCPIGRGRASAACCSSFFFTAQRVNFIKITLPRARRILRMCWLTPPAARLVCWSSGWFICGIKQKRKNRNRSPDKQAEENAGSFVSVTESDEALYLFNLSRGPSPIRMGREKTVWSSLKNETAYILEPEVKQELGELEELRKFADLVRYMSEETGRSGCNYGDTDYDSESVCYGHNQLLEYLKSKLPSPPKSI